MSPHPMHGFRSSKVIMREIDQRFKPPVRGIDLWQAMNYISLEEVGRKFIYDGYTSATICYSPGSRPLLEDAAQRVCGEVRDPFDALARLVEFVSTQVRWAGFYEKESGRQLPLDRNFTEEQILDSGFGWCNEQARLLCALAQIKQLPARLVFASNSAGGFGHCVTEVLTPGGWILIDQSMGYLFMCDGRPVNAWEVCHIPSTSDYFSPIYREMCRQLEAALGTDILSRDFKMTLVENPLCGFETLGYCSCFV